MLEASGREKKKLARWRHFGAPAKIGEGQRREKSGGGPHRRTCFGGEWRNYEKGKKREKYHFISGVEMKTAMFRASFPFSRGVKSI